MVSTGTRMDTMRGLEIKAKAKIFGFGIRAHLCRMYKIYPKFQDSVQRNKRGPKNVDPNKEKRKKIKGTN